MSMNVFLQLHFVVVEFDFEDLFVDVFESWYFVVVEFGEPIWHCHQKHKHHLELFQQRLMSMLIVLKMERCESKRKRLVSFEYLKIKEWKTKGFFQRIDRNDLKALPCT